MNPPNPPSAAPKTPSPTVKKTAGPIRLWLRCSRIDAAPLLANPSIFVCCWLTMPSQTLSTTAKVTTVSAPIRAPAMSPATT